MSARLELGQAAYSAGLLIPEVAPALVQWAASVYTLPPPWWPELAPLSRAERELVWKQIALEAAFAARAQPVAQEGATP